MTLATVEGLSDPSDGIALTQCTGFPATTFGLRSDDAAAPHHPVAASAPETAGRASARVVLRTDIGAGVRRFGSRHGPCSDESGQDERRE